MKSFISGHILLLRTLTQPHNLLQQLQTLVVYITVLFIYFHQTLLVFTVGRGDAGFVPFLVRIVEVLYQEVSSHNNVYIDKVLNLFPSQFV